MQNRRPTASEVDDVFASLEAQLASLSSPPVAAESELERQLRTWREKAEKQERTIADQQSKIQRLIAGIKEERALQQKTLDEIRDRAESAEKRADSAEEKLAQFIELVRQEKERNPKAFANAPSNLKASLDLDTGFSGSAVDTNRLAEQIIALESKIEELENANYELQQINGKQKMEIVDLKSQLNFTSKSTQSSSAQLNQAERRAAELAIALQASEEKVRLLQTQISNSQSVSWKTGSLRGSDIHKMSSNTLSVSDQRYRDLQERAQKAKEQANEYADKLNKLIVAVKKERAKVKEQIAYLQQRVETLEKEKASGGFGAALDFNKPSSAADGYLESQVRELQQRLAESEEKLKDAESRVRDAELRAAFSGTGSDAPPPPPMGGDDFAEGGGGPPPPPPPPPPVSLPKSTKLKITKAPPKPNPNALSAAQSTTDSLIEEIKRGVKLRSVPKPVPGQRKPPPVNQKGVIDMNNLGMMASEIAKQRQQRMKQPKPVLKARQSVALTDLLKELDEMEV